MVYAVKLLQSLTLAISSIVLVPVIPAEITTASESVFTSNDSMERIQDLGFYPSLESALVAKDWRTANTLTRQLVTGIIFPRMYESVQMERLTCETLQTIDGMWRQYSDGQFGFSVQGVLAPPPLQASTHMEWVNRWGDRLGWYQPTPLEERSAQWQTRESFAWKLSDEINYSTTAPKGHLPWIGEDADRIIGLSEADKAPCGSCAYEAFYQQSARYYEYLPALFRRLETCQLLTEP